MGYAVAVNWRSVEGHEQELADLIERVATASRAEPGNLVFETHVSATDPREFFLYELFVDEAAYQAHRDSAHVRTFIADQAAPHIETRSTASYSTIPA